MYRSRIIFVFASIYLFWLLLSGNLTPANVILGILTCIFTMLFFRGFLLSQPKTKLPLFSYIKRTLVFFLFLPIFFFQAYKSSLQVLRLVIKPKIELNQGIVKVPTDVKSINGMTMLANLITLTPGTISVDIDEDNQAFYVHWINVTLDRSKDIKEEIIGAFEPWMIKIFDRT